MIWKRSRELACGEAYNTDGVYNTYAETGTDETGTDDKGIHRRYTQSKKIKISWCWYDPPSNVQNQFPVNVFPPWKMRNMEQCEKEAKACLDSPPPVKVILSFAFVFTSLKNSKIIKTCRREVYKHGLAFLRDVLKNRSLNQNFLTQHKNEIPQILGQNLEKSARPAPSHVESTTRLTLDVDSTIPGNAIGNSFNTFQKSVRDDFNTFELPKQEWGRLCERHFNFPPELTRLKKLTIMTLERRRGRT